MNVRRFVGKNAREAMAQARAAYGDQAVVLSNRPVPGGVEILAMPSADVPVRAPREEARSPAPAARVPSEPMSTVSFEAFVRERQRQEAQEAPEAPVPHKAQKQPAASIPPAAPVREQRVPPVRPVPPAEPARFAAQALQQELLAQAAASEPAPGELMAEMKQMRQMIAGQLASLSWFDNVRRSPTQTRLLRQMLANGFSPVLARYLIERLPADGSEAQADQWLQDALVRNLRCVGADSIQRTGGVFALVGPTGVGKTTTTAKLAARFALEHGPASVGLITVDTYRMAASDQLRAFGRILNIPVHTARDAASLADLLDLFAGKKLVLVDTVGLGQRDRRLAELFAALPAGRLQRLLVLNAGAQGEMLEEVVQAYGAGRGTRCVISKLDEAARCGAALDVVIRHQLQLEGFTNGQRVPEDWHDARAQLLVHKALMKPATGAFMPADDELGLVLTAPPAAHGARHA